MHFDSCSVRGPSKRPISLVKNVQFHLRFLSMKPFCMSVWCPVGLIEQRVTKSLLGDNSTK